MTLFLTFPRGLAPRASISAAWRASQQLGRVRGSANSSLNRYITLTLVSLFLKSVIFVSTPVASLDGGFSCNGVWPPPFELPI